MSSDKDFVQLVDDRVHIWNPIRKLLLTPENVESIYKIPAHNYLTYRILDGDQSDNIKGVRGIGLKTLQKITIQKESLQYALRIILHSFTF